MKKPLLLLFLSFLGFTASAQLINDGSTIVIEQGATLVVKGNADNQAGTITSSGELIIGGNLTNTAQINSTATNSAIIFTGSIPSVFTVGNTNLHTLRNEKNGADISLIGDLKLNSQLVLTDAVDSRLNIDDADLTLTASGGVSGASSNRYVSTDGDGYLIREVNGDDGFTFPVGNNDDGLTELDVEYSGTSFTNARLKVRVNPTADPNLPANATDYVNRHWDVVAENISGYENELQATYLNGDRVGQTAQIKGASYADGNWSYRDADRVGNVLSGTIDADEASFTGSNFYGQVLPQVFLQGCYDSNTGMMRTTLADNGYIPLVSPYLDAPATVASIPANVVDWVKVELRDVVNPSAVLARESGFLLADGSIVATDGISRLAVKDAPLNARVAIYHRNHLPLRTNSAFNLSEPVSMDLSTLANVYNNPAITENTPVKLLGGGVYGMWSGDANGSGSVSYNGGGNDRTSVLIKVGFATPNNTVSGYHNEDINMNGNVSYNGGGNDRTSVLINVGFATPNKVITKHVE